VSDFETTNRSGSITAERAAQRFEQFLRKNPGRLQALWNNAPKRMGARFHRAMLDAMTASIEKEPRR